MWPGVITYLSGLLGSVAAIQALRSLICPNMPTM